MGLIGRLEDLGVSDIFQILGIGKKTGTLVMNSGSGSAAVWFKGGLVVAAETDLVKESVADVMARMGLVKPSALQMACSVQQKKLPDKSLADMLIEMGAVRKEMVEKAAKKRMERVVFEILKWNEGDFQFELEEAGVNGAGGPQAGWKLSKGVSPEYLLMEGARVHDEAAQGRAGGDGQAGKMSDDGDLGDESISGDSLGGEGSGWEDDWSAPAGRKDIFSLKALTQELRFPNSASEITLLVLRFASDMFQRGVLFMAGPEELSGLGQFGLQMEEADEKIRQINIRFTGSEFLNRIITGARTYRGPVVKDPVTEKLFFEMGGPGAPGEAAFFPLIAEEKVVALLYCDNAGDEEMPETEGLEIFITHAGLALEKALLQRRLQEMQRGGIDQKRAGD